MDLNIEINRKKAKRAAMIGALEEKLNKEYVNYDLHLVKFKSKIRKPDGKLTVGDMKKLDSVKRKVYAA